VTCGSTATLTARGAAPGAELVLSLKRASEAQFRQVGAATPGADGTVSWSIKPPQTTAYRVDQAGASAETTVGVRPRVSLDVSAPEPLTATGQVRYSVSVHPAHPGATVRLTRWTGRVWEPLKDITLGADSTAAVRLAAGKPGKPGKLVVRAAMAADAEHLAGHSLTWKRTVYDKSDPFGVPARYARLIVVSVHHYKLYYYERGVALRVFDCVTGRPGLPTPLGHFRIYAKDPHIGGPYGPYRMRYLGMFAIHGTNEPWLLGKYPRNFSHGCTRLSNAHISWLYPRVSVGTPVWNVP
jgi:lipoprotein-anchoring transpeptidase ErfK/SrfK